ncbi:MarR family winged helix-turn-helix transcriptional regulator [Actinoplanes derwentensis]|uniref:DNA-binding transcriptional regulator, MarR family n=1 Tax=Actinoplanes derwentensis TaxID=113562 RepID=A0A1H2CQP2_9ACTN|nr:MarR family transcriptional regulator [Actinoplanes derwentensis]GID83892.1 MarR family transcriptional regulator [Actinoplanes derwentensis]SDT72386.1 DNA-binding transcriptional regulator, MarR family [Actinoplanes derwentensis]
MRDYGWELSTAVVLFHEAVAQRLGLSAAEHKALGVILRSGPMPIGALAPALGVGVTALTGIVDRLERAGYVQRRPDPADRRRTLLVADPAKRPDLGGIFADLTAAMGEFTSRYDEAQLAVITDYLDNTIRVLREQTTRLAG